MLNRRAFLLLMMTSLVAGMLAAGPQAAFAKDSGKGSDGDGGGGDNDGGGDDDGGGNSGHGGGDDDDRDDDDRDDDDKDDKDDKDDDDKDDDDKDDKKDTDKNKIRAAVKRGEAESLGNILPAVRRQYPGKVVRIQLAGRGSRLTYRIRMINRKNQLIEVRVNARNGKILGVYNL